MDPMTVLVFAMPVALAALGETVVQRSGLINIGLEGVMLNSALFGLLVSLGTGSPWLGLLAGCGVGLLTAVLFGAFAVSWGVDQVVLGTAINLLALGLTGTVFRDRFGATGDLLNAPMLPKVLGVDPMIAIGILIAIVLTLLLQRTTWGLAVKSAGHYPEAATAAGYSVTRLRYEALMIGGLLGGLGGAYLSVGIARSFAENMTAGRGFVAIAMVTFGRWNPVGVLAASLLIGVVESLQLFLQAKGWQAPYQLMLALPYLVALAVLVVAGRGSMAPAALGRPYKEPK